MPNWTNEQFTLRAHVSAAPLKPTGRGSSAQSEAPSPRSRERGPVEATTKPFVALMPPSSLRAHVSAAPLKHQESPWADHVEHALRAHVSAAPLKRFGH